MSPVNYSTILTAALLLAPVGLAAQDTIRVARTTRVATAPQIDGRLSEAVWGGSVT